MLRTSVQQEFSEKIWAKDQLGSLLDAAPSGVLLTNLEGLILYANQKALVSLADEQGNLCGQNLQSLVDPSEKFRVLPMLASLLEEPLDTTEFCFQIQKRSLLLDLSGRVIEFEDELYALFSFQINPGKSEQILFGHQPLVVSEAQLRSIVDHASELIFVLDQEGLIKRANPAAHRSLGVSAGKLCSRLFESFVLKEFRGLFQEGLGRVLEGEKVRLELPITSPGWALWVDFTSGIFGAGDELQIFWIGRNITERRQKDLELRSAKEALEEANRTLEKRVSTRTRALVSLHDLARDLSKATEEKDLAPNLLTALQRVTPADVGMVILRGDSGLIEGSFAKPNASPELLVTCHELAQRALADALFTPTDNKTLPPPLSTEIYAPLFLEEEVAGILWLGMLEDSNTDEESKKLLELIAHDGSATLFRIRATHDAQREMLQAMVNALEEGAIMLGEEEQILAANSLGRERFFSLCDCEQSQVCKLHKFIRVFSQSNQTMQSIEFHKEERIYVLRATQVNQPVTNEAMVSISLRDVTEERAMARSVVEREKMASVGMLAAGVAHEINNPAAYVLSNLSYLQELFSQIDESRRQYKNALNSFENGKEAGKVLQEKEEQVGLDLIAEELPQILQESSEGMHRIRDIVKDLRNFARPQSDKLEEVSLAKVLDSVLQMASSELKLRCQVIREYKTSPNVCGHSGRLAQVFLNLVVNAAQSMKKENYENNRLLITHQVIGDRVLIRLEDSGHGIPEEDLSRIFEPFFTTKDSGLGTGLGLAISRDIIRRHHGEIFVESTPGQGSTFVVALPLFQALQEPLIVVEPPQNGAVPKSTQESSVSPKEEVHSKQ